MYRESGLIGPILTSALNASKESIVSGFLLVVLIPHERSTFAGEDVWDPRVFIGDTPCENLSEVVHSNLRCRETLTSGHAYASLHRKAAGSNSLVYLSLLVQLRLSSWGIHASVNLSVGNVDVLACHLAECAGKHLLRWSWTAGSWCLLDRKMGLETNSVDLDASSFHHLDDSLSPVGFSSVVLEVVVVVETKATVSIVRGPKM